MGNSIPSCIEDGEDYRHNLSQEAIDWIKYYCTDIYVYYSSSSFSLPPAVITSLANVKRCGKTKVYRGMSFSLHNIDKAIALVESTSHDNTLEIASSLPMSTSIRKKIAKSFADNGEFGMLLELEADQEDILVDLTLLDINYSVWGVDNGVVYHKREKEVILLPSTYKFKVLSYPRFMHADKLLAIQELLRPYFRQDKVLASTITLVDNVLLMSNGKLIVYVYLDYDEINITSTKETRITLSLKEGDIVIEAGDPDDTYYYAGNDLSFLSDNAEVLFG